MALTIVYKEAIHRLYKASTFSAANIWKWFSDMLIIVLTFLIAFETQGFWKKTNTYREQPSIEFDQQLMVVLSDGSSDPFNYYFWSPFGELNRAQSDRLLMPVLEIQTIDNNGDNVVDEFTIDVNLHLNNSSFRVRSVFWALFYSASLNYRSLINLNGVLMGETERITAGSSLTVLGDLRFWQRSPVPSYGRYNHSQDIIQFNETELLFSSAAYLPFELQKNLFHKNFSIQQLVNWDSSVVENSFSLQFHFTASEQEIMYRTAPLELLKWVWIQFLAVSVLVRFLIERLSAFLYSSQVLDCVIYDEHSKQKLN